MIETYKIATDKYDTEIEKPINLHQHSQNTRGNSHKLRKTVNRNTKPIRSKFFSNRIINFWNELPDKVILAPSTRSFERRLDKFWKKYDIKYDYDKCLVFEDQKRSGAGTINLISQEEEMDF